MDRYLGFFFSVVQVRYTSATLARDDCHFSLIPIPDRVSGFSGGTFDKSKSSLHFVLHSRGPYFFFLSLPRFEHAFKRRTLAAIPSRETGANQDIKSDLDESPHEPILLHTNKVRTCAHLMAVDKFTLDYVPRRDFKNDPHLTFFLS